MLSGRVQVPALALAGLLLSTPASLGQTVPLRHRVYEPWPFNAEEAVSRQRETASALRIPVKKAVSIGSGVTMEFVLIPAGTFVMGMPEPSGLLELQEARWRLPLWSLGFVFAVLCAVVLVRSRRSRAGPRVAGRLAAVALAALALTCVTRAFVLELRLAGDRRVRADFVDRYEHYWHDIPAHEVTITRPFYLGKTEVTLAQWLVGAETYSSGEPTGNDLWSQWRRLYLEVNGVDPTSRGAAGLPAEGMAWILCKLFSADLSQRTGLRFRLPTEAEWEYACRAGSQYWFHFGESDLIDDFAWYSTRGARRGGALKPNAWGLHDMHGNLMEWCLDSFSYDYERYKKGSREDPCWQADDSKGLPRALRGGFYWMPPGHVHCSSVTAFPEYASVIGAGCRLVLEIQQEGD